jgi:enoyl-CoA hydratase/carnithine racemase
VAGAGGLRRLARMIPRKQAMGMILTSRRVSAGEGARLGFVTTVVPHAQPMTEARSEDAIEGPQAFAQKRKPVWKGR